MTLVYFTLGVVFFLTLFFLIRSFLRVTLVTKYEHIDEVEEAATTVSMRLVSAIQAVMSCSVGLVTIYLTCDDVLYDVAPILIPYCSFGVPYMLYDIYAMLTTFQTQRSYRTGAFLPVFKAFLKKQWLLTFHHLAIVLVGFPIVVYFRNGKGDFFMGCLLLTELSTPFYNFRYILQKMQWYKPTLVLKSTILSSWCCFSSVNSAFPIHVFSLCKI
ncbi:ceramide synthase-like isoform X2 [Amphiura filiformis]|uniref:ceramide synthase-like isoform X2 n=1 Tax=Amphiura filiformis TaxID=82378 RepID=UPI003B20E3D1